LVFVEQHPVKLQRYFTTSTVITSVDRRDKHRARHDVNENR